MELINVTMEEQDNVLITFRELQGKGLIPKERRLKARRRYLLIFKLGFKSGILFRNTILYHPKFSRMELDSLRFILLHEEGHLERKQNSSIFMTFILLVILGSIFMITYSGWGDGKIISALSYSLLPLYFGFVFIALKAFSGPLQEDEREADLFAARKLKEGYGTSRPSVIAQKAFAEYDGYRTGQKPDRVKSFFLGGIHPSDEERVALIKRKVDNGSMQECMSV